jgi:hypothetical protein
MVHALAESWRLMRFGGTMIDLRPMASGWPVEIVSKNSEIIAGLLDDNNRKLVDAASDDAVSEAVQRGWFKKVSEDYFDYEYYWDTVEEMVEYVESDWCNAATIPESVLAEVHRLVDVTGEEVEIRIRRAMVIASYRKLGN